MEKIVLSVDTGQDDALAIAFAAALKKHIKIEALMATYGNVSRDYTLENTLNIAEALSLTCPVYEGSFAPLKREAVNASYFHGKSGLDGPVFEKRKTVFSSGSGFEKILDLVLSNPKEITFVSVGPMTDLATLKKMDERFLASLKRIVMMGGSLKEGNATPFAEFNIYADPEAAEEIFKTEVEIVMFGLDGTNDLRLSKDMERAIMEENEGDYKKLFSDQMKQYGRANMEWNRVYPAFYDPAPISYFADPNIFRFERHKIAVDLSGGKMYGRTVSVARNGNVLVAVKADPERFWHLYRKTFKDIKANYKGR